MTSRFKALTTLAAQLTAATGRPFGYPKAPEISVTYPTLDALVPYGYIDALPGSEYAEPGLVNRWDDVTLQVDVICISKEEHGANYLSDRVRTVLQSPANWAAPAGSKLIMVEPLGQYPAEPFGTDLVSIAETYRLRYVPVG